MDDFVPCSASHMPLDYRMPIESVILNPGIQELVWIPGCNAAYVSDN